jgi:hypothetical protein
VSKILTFAAAVAVFLGIYALLRRRQATESGDRPPIRWGWLAAIVACAAVAALAGLLF